MLKTSLCWISGGCVTERFIHSAKLFPLKSTESFHGYRIRVANFGTHITLTGNSIDRDGNVVYKLGGLAVENLLLVVDKMNVTVVFRKTILRLILDDGLRELAK